MMCCIHPFRAERASGAAKRRADEGQTGRHHPRTIQTARRDKTASDGAAAAKQVLSRKQPQPAASHNTG